MNGWLNRWLKRENIVFCKPHGEQTEADNKSAGGQISTKWPKLRKKFEPCDIYNADKIGLHYHALPEHTYVFKNQKNITGFKT